MMAMIMFRPERSYLCLTDIFYIELICCVSINRILN